MKMVLEGNHLSFDIEWLLQHCNIETATRMKVRSSKDETRHSDPPSWGATRISLNQQWYLLTQKVYPEPVGCTKCHRFNHIIKCRSRPHCGVCSGPHLTDLYLQMMKEGQKPTTKCPNCNQGHHTRNLNYPEWKKRLNIPPEKKEITRLSLQESS